jgi:WD40 repeat protein
MGINSRTTTRSNKENSNNNSLLPCVLTEVAFRKDSKESCLDIKFSPNNELLAMGSSDNHIYIYKCSLESASAQQTVTLRPLHRLSGHSSYITHIGTRVCITFD